MVIEKYNKLMTEAIKGKKAGKLKSLVDSVKKIFKISIFLIAVLLLAGGCASISRQDAETKALQFVSNNVKFYARNNNSTLNLPRYDFESIKSYPENSGWVVIVHVSAIAGNETKKSDLTVKLGKNGDVAEFNGKKVQGTLKN